VQITDLPEGVIAKILGQCAPASSRCGPGLPLVCRAFRAALNAKGDSGAWGHVAPVHPRQPDCMPSLPLNWELFSTWLAERAIAVRYLELPFDIWPWRSPKTDFSVLSSLARLEQLHMAVPEAGAEDRVLAQLTTLTRIQELKLQYHQDFSENASAFLGLTQLTSLSLHYWSPYFKWAGRSKLSLKVLEPLTSLCVLELTLKHDGCYQHLAAATGLTLLSAALPVFRQGQEPISGLGDLTSLQSLSLLPHARVGRVEYDFTLPFDCELGRLRRLTHLKLQICSQEHVNGSLQPSITLLTRLQSLECCGQIDSNIFEFPAGMRNLSLLTKLSIEGLHFAERTFTEVLPSLAFLRIAHCSGIFPMAVAPPTLRVLAVEEAEDLRLRNTFACSLRRLFSLPGSPFRCTFEQAWTTADRDGSGMLPELMLDLPPLHTLVIVKPYSWRGFVPSMQLQALQDVDLQDCQLYSIPGQLAAATSLRRLRISRNGHVLAFSLADLDVLAALLHLNFLNVAKDTGKSIAGLECKVKPGHHAALPHWNANSMLALQFMLWQLRSRDLTVVLREPCNWGAVTVACSAAAPLDVAGRIALSTALIADLGRPQTCGDDVTVFRNRLKSSVDAWLHSRLDEDVYWRSAAEQDALAELERFQADYFAQQEGFCGS